MIRALAVVLLLILLGGTVYLATRPGQEVTSASNPEVVVTCDGSTGVSADHCRSWGDDVLALGPPSATFELQDVNHLHFSKPLFGLGSPCHVEYYLGRYADDPAWEDDVPCLGE